MPKNPDINAVIIDLGGVIIDIDTNLTAAAFARITGLDLAVVEQKLSPIYDTYERGHWSDSEFRAQVRAVFDIDISDAEIDQAWTELLLELPQQRVDSILALNEHYSTFLLSNTTHIHIQRVNQILYQSTGVRQLNDLFERVYYSYAIQLRKPQAEIYQHVLAQENLRPQATLFLDDSAQNIAAAADLGLHAVQIQPTNTLLDCVRDLV